jgi:hypothetical protein
MLYTLGASTVGVGSRQMTMAFRHLSRVSEPAARLHNGGMQQCAPLRLIWEFDGGRAHSLDGCRCADRADYSQQLAPLSKIDASRRNG